MIDDIEGGYYRVLVDNATGSWFPWTNNSIITHNVDTSKIGLINCTIQYNDSAGQFGTPETVIVDTPNPKIFVELEKTNPLETTYNITMKLKDENGKGIQGVSIKFCWNGFKHMGNCTELKNGIYRFNVSKSSINDTQETVKLNMSLSKTGYTSRTYTTYIPITTVVIEYVRNNYIDLISWRIVLITIMGTACLTYFITMYLIERKTMRKWN